MGSHDHLRDKVTKIRTTDGREMVVTRQEATEVKAGTKKLAAVEVKTAAGLVLMSQAAAQLAVSSAAKATLGRIRLPPPEDDAPGG